MIVSNVRAWSACRLPTLLFAMCLMFFVSTEKVVALEAVDIDDSLVSTRMTDKFEIWLDLSTDAELKDAVTALSRSEFEPLNTLGSTGLKAGAFWSHFLLKNTTDKPISLHIEYVDHQLIRLDAYQRDVSLGTGFKPLVALDLNRPFMHRQIPHNRFVFETQLAAGETSEYFIRFGSGQRGFVFPNLRIWNPEHLRNTQIKEVAAIAFFFGGFFLMSVIALVGGVASREKAFTIYSVYALSKILVWATVLGYTHQFFITERFHWSYMSLSGAVSIFCGLWFARVFLQTRRFIPKFDYILMFMMANAVFLFFCALYQLKSLAIISITLALLLYPALTIAGIIRWYQGAREAAVFAFAWGLLVTGLFVQALRDLGHVEHNQFNYYWPPFASFTEMAVILIAMGLTFRRLRSEKETAESRYLIELERSKEELEKLVLVRTQDLENEKAKAQMEARTDALTHIVNRRYFYCLAAERLSKATNRNQPYSLLMFDIDKFKSINDQYGHAVGDDALCAFAAAITQLIRDEDCFGRIGGEEFSLLIRGDIQSALETAERLRDAVAQLIVETGKGTLKFTTSIGVAHFSNQESIDELLNRADKALYEAKHRGRNCVVEG